MSRALIDAIRFPDFRKQSYPGQRLPSQLKEIISKSHGLYA